MANPLLDEQLAFYQHGGAEASQPTSLDKLNQTFQLISAMGKQHADAKEKKNKQLFEVRAKIAEAHPDAFKSADEMQGYIEKGITDRPVFSMVSQPEGPATAPTTSFLPAPESGIPDLQVPTTTPGMLPAPLAQPQKIATGREPISFAPPPMMGYDETTGKFTELPKGYKKDNIISFKSAEQKPQELFTPEQVKAIYPAVDVEGLRTAYPKGIPKEALSAMGGVFKVDSTSGEKSEQFYQKEWDKIVKDSDPLTASGRTGLGLATKADYNANRALTTLAKPVVTNQEAGNVMADIAAIYQGGSPTQFGMSHQQYSTIYGKAKELQQAITGKPQDALPEAIKQRLVGVLTEMKKDNVAIIKQQLDHIEKAQPKVIAKYPGEWKDIRANLESGVSGGPAEIPGPGGAPTLTPEDQQAIDWARANPKDKRSTQILALHGMK